MPLRHAVIVTAAGSSRRFNESSDAKNPVKKEFLTIGEMPVLCRAIAPFTQVPGLVAVVVTYRDGDLEAVKALIDQSAVLTNLSDVKVLYVKGGDTRQASVFHALSALNDMAQELAIDIVSIHDGARPYVDKALVSSCINAAFQHGGACPCIRMTDTLVQVDKDGFLCGRLSREGVCTVQTPQSFRFPDIYDAHCAAIAGKAYTDDTEIFMDFGKKVAFVQGSKSNIKITYAQDLKEGH